MRDEDMHDLANIDSFFIEAVKDNIEEYNEYDDDNEDDGWD
jgi:hypothetical protein